MRVRKLYVPGRLHSQRRDLSRAEDRARLLCQAGGEVPPKASEITAPRRDVAPVTTPAKGEPMQRHRNKLWSGSPGSGLSLRSHGNHVTARKADPALAASLGGL